MGDGSGGRKTRVQRQMEIREMETFAARLGSSQRGLEVTILFFPVEF